MPDSGDPLPSLDHLRWQCRRGMLELDYVLRRYLDAHYETAPPEQQRQFVALLGMQDQDLLAWLVHGLPPADATLRGIIRRVRDID